MTETISRKANLDAAKKAKNDEFYTQLSDIENELKHYRMHFQDKTIYLNCDDTEFSNFWFFFSRNFNFLGLKRLIATHYTGISGGGPSEMIEMVRNEDGSDVSHEDVIRTPLTGDGDFRSAESVALLEQSDIVVTNPPFSLVREFFAQLFEYDKKFLIIASQNVITYKETWTYLEQGKMWLGNHRGGLTFEVPNEGEMKKGQYEEGGKRFQKFGNITWYTNMENPRRHEDIILFRKYSDDPTKYPKYDNYDAINVDKAVDIPVDYFGNMGVPITFLSKHNPDQFEIVGQSRMLAEPFSVAGKPVKDFVYKLEDGSYMYPYMRIVIKRKDTTNEDH